MINKSKFIVFICCFLVLFASSPVYSAKNSGLRCNLYVIEVMKENKIYLPSSNANDIDTYLKSSDKWEIIQRMPNGKLNHKAAYNAAKSGKYVLATYNGGKKNGHVAIVNGKKSMEYSKGYNAAVPYASGSVRGRKPELIPISYQFSSDKEPKMSYFMYKNNKK